MTNIKTISFYYDIIFIFCLLLIAVYTKNIFNFPALLVIVVPLIVYFWGYLIINSKILKTPENYLFWVFVSILLIFNFLSTSLLLVANIIFSRSFFNVIISVSYLPFPVYFFLTIFDWYKKVQQNNKTEVKITKTEKVTAGVGTPVNIDFDRRRFLKILGGTGVSVFLLSLLNPKQAGAAFFGSVPGPGTVALKNAGGTKINPAEKQATDGYKISKIDDTSSATYAYYGFVNSDGAWYIQQETLTGVNAGNFQYYRGPNNFSSNWGSRGGFTYDDFEDIF
jgi:hypothetical protein